MTSKIQHSDGIKDIYRKYQTAIPEQLVKTQSSLGLAPHRFDSTTKPAAAFVLTSLAIHMTAEHLWNSRRNEAPGKSAKAHLELSSGELGMERLLQMGMLADAGDESMLLT
eukprot:8954615-Pyramimonas_sp.AAC.1